MRGKTSDDNLWFNQLPFCTGYKCGMGYAPFCGDFF